MAEIKFVKKRLSINLSFRALTDSIKQTSAHKSSRNFEEPNGVVGLGILAALNDDPHHHHHHHQDPVFVNGTRTAVLAFPPKSSSNPIPILTNSVKKLSVEEMELCEEYTCVMSRVGDNLIKKREYFEADFYGKSDGPKKVSVVTGNGGFSETVSYFPVSGGGEIATFGVADFLNSCFLCKKMLHGLDIFMYRGEKAFCSAECRFSQISIDEQKEKCHSGARKEYSVSPCAGTLQFFAGVAAA
ncbi:hypothetical protein DH2020_018389 [Rehmannia glutinosa]|uniref:FLZ-type domain-containing protein n=1 Tax=Rehmannia glutinosa TaxID=99300 RepID=A0ABR0WMC5_REHGL